MIHKPVTVVKNERVVVEGEICIKLGSDIESSVQPVPGQAMGPGNIEQARVIESNEQYAIIEIVCSCGAKSHIQCNYGDIAESGDKNE
ncbi:MAG: hypothetical protein KAJ07_13210 [Planctomycetes bacterium]|nr:hypothetical protein [Planctomycetota bacterium]